MQKIAKSISEKKEDVLTISLNLFVSKGFAATTTKEISNNSGISEALIFHYFSSKNKIYEILIQRAVNELETIFSDIDDSSAVGIIKLVSDSLIKKMQTDDKLAKLLFMLKQALVYESTPESAKECARAFDTVEAIIPIIELGQNEGDFRQGPPDVISAAFWGAVFGVAETLRNNPEKQIDNTDFILAILKK